MFYLQLIAFKIGKYFLLNLISKSIASSSNNSIFDAWFGVILILLNSSIMPKP